MSISFSEAKGMFATVIDLVKKGSAIEAQSKIQELQEQYLQLHAENLEIKQDLLMLREEKQQKINMQFEDPFFYLVKGEKKDGPYCPKCWQKDGRKCRVVNTLDSYQGSSKCQVCDSCFGKGKPVPMPKVVSRKGNWIKR